MRNILIGTILIGAAYVFGVTSTEVAKVTINIIQPVVEAPVIEQPVALPIVSQKDVHCLARNMYFEASVEDFKGRIAVGHVVLNRVASKKYPSTVCKVVHQGGEKRRHRCQFSWWCDGKSDKITSPATYETMVMLAIGILQDTIEDPTNGSIMYHADYVKPKWRHSYNREVKLGVHIFYTKG